MTTPLTISEANFYKILHEPKDAEAKGIRDAKPPLLDHLEKSRFSENQEKTGSPQQRIYEQVLNASATSVEEALSPVIPEWILKWPFEKVELLINKQQLNSTFWNTDFPFLRSEDAPSLNFYEMRSLVKTLKDARGGKKWLPPDVSHIKNAIESYFEAQPPSLSYSSIRRFPGTQAPLCPESLKRYLGYIPEVTIKENSVKLNNTATHCNDCKAAFGFFNRRNNCLSCGQAECSHCLEFRRTPDFVDPVPICKTCAGDSTLYSIYWINDVEDPSVRKKITVRYLALLSYYAHPSRFIKWADLFVSEERYDMAFACTYFGDGDWVKLAKKFIPLKNYELAMTCLNQVEKRKDEWMEIGASLATERSKLSLLCYRKAGLGAFDYAKLAREFSDQSFGKLCLIMAMIMTKKIKGAKEKLLKQTAQKATQEKKYALATLCYILLRHPVEKWIEIVNASDRQAASVFVHHMNALSLSDLGSIQFTPDKDHLRWPYLGTPQFDPWLDHLISLLQKCDGCNAIPYFRYEMRHEDFKEHRDRFLAQGEYGKALICHCLMPDRLSWEELAQKWRKKSEMASFACYLCCTEDIERIADRLFEAKDYSLALRCYLSAGNFKKILEHSKNAEYEIRLLYQWAVLKQNTQPSDILLEICQTLQSLPAQVAGQ
jgi:hypothetical protein